MSDSHYRLYDFGAYRIDTRNGLLLRDGDIVAMTPKMFDTLLALVENNGTVMTKDELMNIIWPNTAVEENNLTQYISSLRKILNNGRSGNSYIETIPKRGYRFVAQVRAASYEEETLVVQRHTRTSLLIEEEVSHPDSPSMIDTTPQASVKTAKVAAKVISAENANSRFAKVIVFLAQLNGFRKKVLWSLVLATFLLIFVLSLKSPKESKGIESPPIIKSIAVLPFKNIGDKGNDYLSLGIADAIIAKLSKIKNLSVRPTGAIIKYLGQEIDIERIGKEQNVEAVLVGSIQKMNDDVRVTMQIMRVSDQSAVSSNKFDEKFISIFSLQDTIGKKLIMTLMPDLSKTENDAYAKPFTTSSEAYEAYLKARYYLYKFSLGDRDKILVHFNQAIALDPEFAQAYAGLAEAYFFFADVEMSSKEALEKARLAAQKAIELDSSLAQAHISLALVYLRYDWDWANAEGEFLQAIELEPLSSLTHNWYGWYLVHLGKFDEGIAELRIAADMEPLSPTIQTDIGTSYYCHRQYDQAVRQLKAVLEMDKNYLDARKELSWSYMAMGLTQEAIQECLELCKQDPGPTRLSALACAYALAGRRVEAENIIAQLKNMSENRYISAFEIGLIYALLGENDLAFDWLQRACEERSSWLIILKTEPLLDRIRSDPRYHQLLLRIGLAS